MTSGTIQIGAFQENYSKRITLWASPFLQISTFNLPTLGQGMI